MARKRVRKAPESIAELFGDVVQDRPSFLYAPEDGVDDATMSPSPAQTGPPMPANANVGAEDRPPARAVLPAPNRDASPDAPARLIRDPAETPPAEADARPPASQGDDPFAHAATRHSERLRRARAARAAAQSGIAALPRDVAPAYRDDKGLLSAVTLTHGAISVLSLGVYRFWMKTQTRRVLWAHTEVDGERLEYTGRGSELFVGAAIAIACLALIFGAVGFGGAFLGLAHATDLGGGPAGWVPAAGLTLLVLSPLMPVAAFRARRYRLSRTRWKHVRFGMEGSGWSLALLWLVWAPVVAATAGLAWPLWRWMREARMSRAMRWGDAAFAFDGRPWPLAVHWLPLWSLCAMIAAVAASPVLRAWLGLDDPAALLLAWGPLALLAMVLLLGLSVILAWVDYRAAEVRLFMNARSLAGARISCRFSMWHIVDSYMAVSRRNLWPGVAVYVAIFAVASIPLLAAARVEMENPGAAGLADQARLAGFGDLQVDNLFSLDLAAFPGLRPAALDALGETVFAGFHTWRAQGLAMMAVAIDYFLSATFLLWLWTYVYARRRHEHLCDSITLHGVNRLETVRQRAADRDATAEGFDDAFEFALP